MSTSGIIVLLVWLVGAIIAYFTFARKHEKFSIFEQIMYSIAWPGIPFLYLIYRINKGSR